MVGSCVWFTAKIKEAWRDKRSEHLLVQAHFPGDPDNTKVDLCDGKLQYRTDWILLAESRSGGMGRKMSTKALASAVAPTSTAPAAAAKPKANKRPPVKASKSAPTKRTTPHTTSAPAAQPPADKRSR